MKIIFIILFILLTIVCSLMALVAFTPVMHARTLSEARVAKTKYPPFTPTWIKIAQCEQPGSGWRGIAWHQRHNYSFPGGLGMTPLLWTQFRRQSQKSVRSMADASPVEQLWAAYRFWRWAERTYPGYGFTGWECSRIIGWTTSDPRDAVR